MRWRTYEQTRDFVRDLGIKRGKDWTAYCQKGDKPKDIPKNPESVYISEWKGWKEFLATKNYHHPRRKKVWRPFREARDFVKSLGLEKIENWYIYCKTGNKPEDIPVNIWKIYSSDTEWRGQHDFITGAGYCRWNRCMNSLSLSELKDLVRRMGIKTCQDYR